MKVTPVKKKFGKYSPGDVFEFPSKAAKIYIKVGKLAEVTEEKVIVPEPVVPEVEISERTGLPKRVYRRRDMESE